MMMKQEQESKIKSESDELLNLQQHQEEFNDEEIEVARILLDLKQCPIHNFWPLTWFSESNLKWGAKRIRLPLTLLPAPAPAPAPPPPPPPPPVLVVPPEQTDYRRRRRKRRRNSEDEDEEGQVNNNVVAATSPATPLAFSPSESEDDKFIDNKNTNKKRSREELLKTLKELTERNIALKKERESIGSHYNASLAYNRMLKQLEKQVKSYSMNSSSQKPEEPQINYQIHFNNNQFSLLPVLLPLQQQQQQPPQQQQKPPPPPAVMNGESIVGTREQFQYPYFYRQISVAEPPLVSSNGVGLDMDVDRDRDRDRDRFSHVVAPVGSDNMGGDAIAMAIAAASTEGSLRYQKAKCAAAARLERRLKIKLKSIWKHR